MRVMVMFPAGMFLIWVKGEPGAVHLHTDSSEALRRLFPKASIQNVGGWGGYWVPTTVADVWNALGLTRPHEFVVLKSRYQQTAFATTRAGFDRAMGALHHELPATYGHVLKAFKDAIWNGGDTSWWVEHFQTDWRWLTHTPEELAQVLSSFEMDTATWEDVLDVATGVVYPPAVTGRAPSPGQPGADSFTDALAPVRRSNKITLAMVHQLRRIGVFGS